MFIASNSRLLTRLSCGILTALLAAAAAKPAVAAPADTAAPQRGWFVALDAALAEPAGADQHYADQIDLSGAYPRGTRHILDNDTQLASRFTVGYDFGQALGSLRVSYWSFDGEDDVTRSMRGAVEPSLFGYGYYGSAYLYDPQAVQVSASSSIKASVADVSYLRTFEPARKFAIGWMLGVRTASFEEERDLTARDDVAIVEQSKRIDTNAFGFKFGATAQYRFGRLFRLEGGLSLSLMQGDSEGSASQTIRDVDPNAPLLGTLTETRDANQDSVNGQILELDAKGVWSTGPIEFWLGYGASSWSGLVADPNPPPPEGDDRGSLSFVGWRAGIKWKIGRGGGAAEKPATP